MRRMLLMIGCLSLFIVGCSSVKNKHEKTVMKEDSIPEKVETVLQGMSLDEKISQMMIVSFREPVLSDTMRHSLQELKPGGFILFQENFSDYETTLQFVKDVKKTNSVPMFLGVDQEGGLVQRLKSLPGYDVTVIPSMYQVGKKQDSELTEEVAQVIAEELRVFGINMDFAPSLDIYSNPENQVIGTRSFGETSELVSTQGKAFGRGLEKNRVLPVYKHFPGHGDTSTDSHYELPIVQKSLEELRAFELKPFEEVIGNGAMFVMVGHLAVPKITGDDTPATLSKAIVTDLLKEEMGFDGLVMTDALDMEALTDRYSTAEIVRQAVVAGVDILLIPSSLPDAIQALHTAVDQGILTEERIDDSVRKILTVKYREIEPTYGDYLPDTYLGSAEHKQVIARLTE